MDIFRQLYLKITANEKLCFFSALFFGFFTHTYMLTHKLPNGDDACNFQDVGVAAELGRWFLRRANRVTVIESNPWFNGVLALVFISLACVFIYKTLGFKRKMSAVLLSAVVMTFPSLCSTMPYMFTVDLYAMGLLLAILSAYLVTKSKWLAPLGCICLVLSMSLYQAYICFTITLLLLVMIRDMLRDTDEKVFRKYLLKGIYYVIFLALSTIAYLMTCRLVYPGIVHEQEHNVGAMGQISLVRLPRLMARAYRRFLYYFALGEYSFITPIWQVINLIVLVLLITLWFFLLLRYKKDKWRIALVVLASALLPVGNSFVDIMAPDAAFSTLMIYQFCLVYIALIGLLEFFPKVNEIPQLKKPFQVISTIGVISIFVLIYLQFRLTSIAYFHTDLAYRHCVAYLDRVITHVEGMEGYTKNDPILILGDFDDQSVYGFPRQDEALLEDLSGIAHEHDIMTQYVRECMVNIYLGKQIPFYDDERDIAITATQAYQEMSIYPGENSIQKIDDYWVVKLSP